MFLTLSLCTALSLGGQSWRGWSFAGFEVETGDRFALFTELEHRFDIEQPRQFRSLATLGVERKLTEELTLTPAVRWSKRRGSGSEYRLFADLDYTPTYGTKTFRTDFRLRYQQDRPFDSQDGGLESALRPSVTVIYTLWEKVSPFAGYELRYRFDQRQEVSRHRYTAGFDIEFTHRWTLEAFFRIEDFVNGEVDRATERIIGLGFTYAIPNGEERMLRRLGRQLI